MKKTVLHVVLVIVFLVPGWVLACSEPEKPGEFPDPATAATAQMVKAHNEVKAYVKDMEAYLECANMPRSQRERAVAELQDYAESFNKLIREFKNK